VDELKLNVTDLVSELTDLVSELCENRKIYK
jgi:hypothetical protein